VHAQVASGAAELRPDRDRRHGWTLLLDGTPQSHVDLDDPTHLEFDYVRRLGHVVDVVAPPRRPLRVLHLGGGAFTLPRYLAATRPGFRTRPRAAGAPPPSAGGWQSPGCGAGGRLRTMARPATTSPPHPASARVRPGGSPRSSRED